MADEKHEPAFPIVGGNTVYHTGMTLRDYFAGQALIEVLREFNVPINGERPSYPVEWRIGVAVESYKMADAMMKARDA